MVRNASISTLLLLIISHLFLFIDLSDRGYGNRQSREAKLGESDPVGNLSIVGKDRKFLTIKFLEPVKTYGKIINYELFLNKIHICAKMTKNIHYEENNLTKINNNYIYKYISSSSFDECGDYFITVFPIISWNGKSGIGRPTSTMYHNRMSQSSTVTIDAKFISSNSLKVILKEVRNDKKCETNGFVIEITNENNHKNCITRIISNIDCIYIKNMVSNISNCINVTRVNYDNHSAYVEESFVGIFESQNKHKMKVWIIRDEIDQLASINIGKKYFEDCFSDCFEVGKSYFGMKSVTRKGVSCMQWEKYRTRYGLTKSNLCISSYHRPWCLTGTNSWDHCDVPICSSIDEVAGCVNIKIKHRSAHSIGIQWSAPLGNISIIGYIILLYNIDYQCIQYNVQLCKFYSLDSLSDTIKAFYLFCKSATINQGIGYKADFHNLVKDQQYIVFIIPIINMFIYGKVKKVTINTHLPKPDIPQNILILSESLNQIEISWNKQIKTNQFGIADQYLIVMTNSIINETKRMGNENINVTNLEICTQYCFILSSENTAGSSEWSKEICTYTLAPAPIKVELEELKSGYLTNQIVRWKYSINNNCENIFLVQYQIRYTEKIISIQTKLMNITITNLRRNVIYIVKVRSENQMKTVNNETIGPFSEIQEFFTGKAKPFISDYKKLNQMEKSFNISWILDDEMRGSMFEFIVILKDSTNICQYLLHSTCTNCEDPLNQRYLSKNQSKQRRQLLDCNRVSNQAFKTDMNLFSYSMNFDDISTDFVVEIFGINMMGIHQLSKKCTIIKMTGQTSSMITKVFIYVIFLTMALVVAFVIMRYKRNGRIFKINCRSKSNEIPMINIEESVIEKTPCIESKTNVIGTIFRTKFMDLSKRTNLKSRQINESVSLIEFPKYYEQISLNGGELLIQEYKKLSNKSKSIQFSLGLTVESGTNSKNTKKNRFMNMVHFGIRKFSKDYINAGHIPFVNDMDNIEYIASQGPINENLSEFWEMIWERDINCIIMLTRTTEGDEFKCLQYWPNDIDEIQIYGNINQFVVTLAEEEENESYVERNLNLLHMKTNENKKLKQLQMVTWFDHSAPNLNHFDRLLFRFHELSKEDINHPYLVHCSAGVGRTGTFICLDRIVKELLNGCQEINIYKTFLTLRKYYHFMVPRQAQYVFIHDYINHYLAKYMKITQCEEKDVFQEELVEN